MFKRFAKQKAKKDSKYSKGSMRNLYSQPKILQKDEDSKYNPFNKGLHSIPSFDWLLPPEFDKSSDIYNEEGNQEHSIDSDQELRDEIEKSITKSHARSQNRSGVSHTSNVSKYKSPTYESPNPKSWKDAEKDYVTFGKHLKFNDTDRSIDLKLSAQKSMSEQVKSDVFKNGTFNLTEILKEVNTQLSDEAKHQF